jgi:hypothetical protein
MPSYAHASHWLNVFANATANLTNGNSPVHTSLMALYSNSWLLLLQAGLLGFAGKGSVTLSTVGPNSLEANPLYFKQTEETSRFEQVPLKIFHMMDQTRQFIGF